MGPIEGVSLGGRGHGAGGVLPVRAGPRRATVEAPAFDSCLADAIACIPLGVPLAR